MVLVGIDGVDPEQVLPHDLVVAGPAGHGAGIVVLQFAVGRDDIGVIFAVGHQFVGFLKSRVVEFAQAAFEGVLVQDFGAFAIGQ